MIKNYFKTALRNIKRNKSYTLINMAGLTVGIAACMLIILVIRFQTSFDNFHKERDRIYRVASVFETDNGKDYSGAVSLPVANGIRLDYPMIREVASVYRTQGQISIHAGNEKKIFAENNFYYAEPEFFSMFNFPFLKGNPGHSFSHPNDALLTKATAEKMFGSAGNAIGKTIQFDNENLYTVSGILQNTPANTDFPLSIVVPYSALSNTKAKDNLTDWVSIFGGGYTFIKLPPQLSEEKMNKSFPSFARRHKPAEYTKDGYILQPLAEMHYDSRFGNYNRKTFSHELINALSLIGIFLIIIACINFVNLATAQGVNRSREIGIRKVLGGNKKQLVIQNLLETSTIVLTSCLLSLGIAILALPYLNQLLESHMQLSLFTSISFIILVTITFAVTTLLSGLYPALVLSRHNPIKALKNKAQSNGTKGLSLRRGLVVFQFVVAQILILGVLVVVSQMNFFNNADLGYNKESIVTINFRQDSSLQSKLDYFRQQLMANPAIRDVSYSFGSPTSPSSWQSDIRYDHSEKPTNFNVNLKWADANYYKTYGIKLIAGKAYPDRDTISDFVVNECLLQKLGVTDPKSAIGKEINLFDGRIVAKISGVVRDFNSFSLEDPMMPVILGSWKSRYRTANVKIAPAMASSVIPFLEKKWNSLFPDYLFEYKFLDQTIADFYKTENQLSQLYKIFAAIAILISCLGLYGLVTFMANQRTKEIGVRKVLGASAMNIVYLLSGEFTLLIVVAFMISAPIAWYIMHLWLQNFSFRVDMSVWIFAICLVSSVCIAWITVSYRAIRAAMADPVKSLRSE